MKKLTRARLIFSTIAVLILSVICTCLMLDKPTLAVHEDFVEKWFLTAHYQCIINGSAEDKLSPDDGTTQIAAQMYSSNNSWQPLPSANYFDVGKNEEGTYCVNVLKGDTDVFRDFTGVLEMAGLGSNATWSNSSDAGQLVEKLGYSPTSASMYIKFKEAYSVNEGREKYNSAEGCIKATPMQNGQISYEQTTCSNEGESQTQGDIEIFLAGNDLGIKYTNSDVDDRTAREFSSPAITLTNNIGETINKINGAIGGYRGTSTRNYGAAAGLFDQGVSTTYSLKTEAIYSDYILGDRTEAAERSIRKLKGLPDDARIDDALRPSDQEYYNLFNWYLSDGIEGMSSNPMTSGTLACQRYNDSAQEIHLQSGGAWYKYYLDSSKINRDARYWVLRADGNRAYFEGWSIDQIIGWLNTFHEAKDAPAGSCPAPDGAEQMDATESGEDACFKYAESLGWITCPIIKGISETVNTLYERIISPFLEINVSAFSQDNGVYQAWQIFQSFANIVFVILFLVVIISQVTGVGIDNLGIKRILPKLIIAAVLVNVSYIICMLLVDVSNIAGSSLYTLFDGVTLNGETVGAERGGAVGFLIGALGLTGGVAAIAWFPGIVPALLLGLVGIIIGVLTLFVLLGVYQAGVIIAVIVSPVAFVLYMLPNTKSIFDRWRKIFQALLLLYPTCGLMMGGSNFASKVLLLANNDSFWMSLLAALLSIIPFFFIPSIVKGTMNAMGNLGAKISGLGKGLSGKTQGAISNSEAFQQWQRNRAAGVNSRGESTLRGNLMRKIAGGNGAFARSTKRKLMRAEAGWLKNEKELGNYDPDGLQTRIQAMDKDLEESQVLTAVSSLKNSEDFKSGNFGKMGKDLATLLETDKNGENAIQIKAYTDALNSVGEDGRQAISDAFEDAGIDFAKISQQGRQAFARNIMEKHGADFKNNHRSLFELAKANNGAVGSGKFSDYAPGGSQAAGVDSYKAEQYANMDDGEFDRIEAQYQSLLAQRDAATDEAERQRLNEQITSMQELAHEAVSNENIIGSAKKKRVKKLETMASGRNPSSNTPSSGIATATPNPNRAQPNQSFNVHNSSSDTQSSIATPGTKEYNQAADNLKKNNS